MAKNTMVYRFEKILLISLIFVFGLLPLIAYPLLTGTIEQPVTGTDNNKESILISTAFEQLAAVVLSFGFAVFTLILR